MNKRDQITSRCVCYLLIASLSSDLESALRHNVAKHRDLLDASPIWSDQSFVFKTCLRDKMYIRLMYHNSNDSTMLFHKN